MAFNLNDYETVEERITKFWKEFPDGRIETELLEAGTNRFVVEARIFRTEADAKPYATDMAAESFKPETSLAEFALERCSTSAIGRALATGGFATKKRASREEMAKVNRVTNDERSETIANAPLAINNTWDEFVSAEPKQPVVTLGEAAELVQQSFSEAEPIPTCSHGDRNVKQGITNGKAWRGAMCSGKGLLKADQCQAIWYVLSKTTGKFRLPDGVE
tara:strand:- start:301 stop:957 length:657 start_codon:yes stop_codon:yes gene_type:complete